MRVHLVDGTFELFRHFYGLRHVHDSPGYERAAVAGVIQTLISMLEGAEFGGLAINEQQAKQLISAGQTLLGQASACASNPGSCAN